MTEKKTKPEIRFKGFDGNWDKKKLADVSVFSKGIGYSKNDLVETGVPIILYGRLYTKYQTIISAVDTFVFPRDVSTFSEGNEVVVPASGETAEDIARASAILKKGILIGGDLNIISPKDDIDSIFLAITISTGKPKNELSKRAQGKSIVHLRNSDLKEICIQFPCKEEQTQIGNFFNHLDTLINLHQRRYDKLTTLKTAMLEKMFPKAGSDVPEIRFKEFMGKWEMQKIKDVCSISTGKSNTQDRIEDGIYPFFVRSPIIEQSNRYLFDEEAVLTVGDGVGTGKVFHYVNGRYDLHQRVYRMFDFSKGIIGRYFYYYFSNHFYDRVMAMTAKTSVDSVRYEMISEMEIKFPSIQEQTEIAKVFQHLDSLTALQQKELEKLKTIKKACLEKMFV